jgi:hypothetical protein
LRISQGRHGHDRVEISLVLSHFSSPRDGEVWFQVSAE